MRLGVPFYEQEVVKAFRQTDSQIIGQLLCLHVRKRVIGVKGRPTPGASGPLTREGFGMLRSAGEHRLLRSPACKPFGSHIYQRQHLLQSSLRPWSEAAVIARVRLQCLTHLLSAGAWPASS